MLLRSSYLVLVSALMMASCTASNPGSGSLSSAANPNTPGATGQTVVPGSHSSMTGSNRLHPDWADAATDAGAGRR